MYIIKNKFLMETQLAEDKGKVVWDKCGFENCQEKD